MHRRKFLQNTALASSAMLAPSFLRSSQFRALQPSRSGKILVVIQLSGGNDGLNTLVPYRNDIYHRSRPALAVPEKEVLKVERELGFNPALAGLRELYDDGLVSIINSVGYPNPDRSHFRSMDIWHTASDSDEYLTTGWLGRYLDSQCQNCAPYHALEIDNSLSLAMKGQERNGFAMSKPDQLQETANNRLLRALGQRRREKEQEENVAYLYKTMIDTQQSADYLYQQSRVHRSTQDYPNTPFGRDLQRTAELITADTDTKIYYLSLTGFDTHANQKNQQERLLQQYGDGLKAFVTDLRQHNLLEDTLIMTFSEFGRRVEQNASNGTDHGTANNLFLIGGKLQHPGLFNAAPDLSRLDKGDLIYQIDFRQIYATLLEDWLQADATGVLGRRFERLALLQDR